MNTYDQTTTQNPLARLADQFGFYIADNDGQGCLVVNDEIGAEHHDVIPEQWATSMVLHYDLVRLDAAARLCAYPETAHGTNGQLDEIMGAFALVFGRDMEPESALDHKRVELINVHIMAAGEAGGFNCEYE